MKFAPFLVIVILLALGWSAHAEQFVPDGKATANMALREFLPKTGDWSRASMRAFLGHVLVDQKVDETEQELLRELQAGEVLVTFSDGSEAQAPHPDGEARKQLLLIIVPRDFNSLWKAGPEGARIMVGLATLAPVARHSILQNTTNQLYASWNKSTLDNEYKPVREDIAKVYQDMKAAGGETFTEGVLILHEAMSFIDKSTRDSVPNHLYDWLAKPNP